MKNSDAYIIFFDGHCALCHFWVRKILQNDKRQQFKFASLQSTYAQAFLQSRGLDPEDSLVVWLPKEAYWLHYPAICVISKTLGGYFNIFLLGRILPLAIANTFYRWLAANRKRWFGSYDQCPLPDPKFQDRFIN